MWMLVIVTICADTCSCTSRNCLTTLLSMKSSFAMISANLWEICHLLIAIGMTCCRFYQNLLVVQYKMTIHFSTGQW